MKRRFTPKPLYTKKELTDWLEGLCQRIGYELRSIEFQLDHLPTDAMDRKLELKRIDDKLNRLDGKADIIENFTSMSGIRTSGIFDGVLLGMSLTTKIAELRVKATGKSLEASGI